MIQFDWDWRSKTIDIHFCLFYGLYQIIINTFIKAIATHETHFSIKPVLSYIETILSLFIESSKMA